MRFHAPLLIAILALAATAALAACGGDDEQQAVPTIDTAAFRAKVDNPFWPLDSVRTTVYEGEERDPDSGDVIKIRVESSVLARTETVAGVEVSVVEVKEYEDGELVEVTLDYYAQHSDGTVYYFGERVDDYEDGEVVGHTGQWLAGEGKNQPGVFMPAQPALDQTFEQERAPGIAEDTSTVVGTGESVTTAAGAFTGCVKTRDFSPIDNATEHKFYCPGVGLVREESEDAHLDLVDY